MTTREEKDQEKAEYIRQRQERLGHVPAEVVESKPKAEPKAGTKSAGTHKKAS